MGVQTLVEELTVEVLLDYLDPEWIKKQQLRVRMREEILDIQRKEKWNNCLQSKKKKKLRVFADQHEGLLSELFAFAVLGVAKKKTNRKDKSACYF